MNTATQDPARNALMLTELRLPTIGRLWPEFAQRSDKEGWPAARFLGGLLEHELAERAKRRIERHRAESQLDPTKTLASFDFTEVPMLSKAHVMALAVGDSWLDKGASILIFGPPGVGKSHVGCGIGHALIDAGYRVLYMRTTELVQRLQAARQCLQLPQALAKLDRYDLLILDDLSYVRKDQAETSVLFELIAERYERRSILITANQPFSAWNNVFPDAGMTVAAIDRLVHHSTIFELNTVESYRGKQAARQQQAQRANDKAQRRRQSSGADDNQPTEAILIDAVQRSPVSNCKLANPRDLPAMPAPHTQASAAELQRHLAELTGHGRARVRPYGKHLLIQMHRDDAVDTVARLTEVAHNNYTAAFRSHTGRWEPLPAAGDLRHTADLVVTLLAQYLEPDT